MKKITTLLALIFAAYASAQTSTLQWAKGWQAKDVVSVAADQNGNVYSIGNFIGTQDFDPGPSTFTMSGIGGSDIFVTKLDASGNFVWSKKLGSAGNDGASQLTLDANGNVYSTGYFAGTADFDPGTGVSNLTAVNYDIFVWKLDASGNFVWAKNMGGAGSEISNAISVDVAGNVYTTGYFNYLSDFDPGVGTYTLAPFSNGGNCIFVSKLDALGDFVWAKSMENTFAGTNSGTLGSGITTDASGNVYTTGSFGKTVDFDPGVGVYTVTCNGGYNDDIFLSKLDANGNFNWAITLGNYNFDRSFSVKCDLSGDVYITGEFYAVVDFDPSAATYTLDGNSSGDAFIAKYDGSGNFVWAKELGGSLTPDYGKCIHIDGNNHILTSGYFEGTGDFDPGAGIANLTATSAAGYGSVFISILDLSGNYLDAMAFNTQLGYDAWPSVTTDGAGNIITGGAFKPISDFDPSAGTYTNTSVTSGAFVSKIGNTITNIKTFNDNNVISIFPNPSSSNFNFTSTAKFLEIKITNILGETILNKITDSATTSIDLSGFSQGVYLYQIIDKDKVISTGKLIKE